MTLFSRYDRLRFHSFLFSILVPGGYLAMEWWTGEKHPRLLVAVAASSWTVTAMNILHQWAREEETH